MRAAVMLAVALMMGAAAPAVANNGRRADAGTPASAGLMLLGAGLLGLGLIAQGEEED